MKKSESNKNGAVASAYRTEAYLTQMRTAGTSRINLYRSTVGIASCDIFFNLQVTCVQPPLSVTGPIVLSVSVDDGRNYSFSTVFYVRAYNYNNRIVFLFVFDLF